MLFIKTVAIPCPADLHCFTGADCDELIGHLCLNRNREPLIAYETSGFLSVLFHRLRDPKTREGQSCLWRLNSALDSIYLKLTLEYSVLSCRQLAHDHCSCLIPLKASKQLQHLWSVLGPSERLGKGCPQDLLLHYCRTRLVIRRIIWKMMTGGTAQMSLK